jgi:argininosuccinate synthase
MKRIVLAYSGGLDTSVCIPYLMDKGYEVICFMADVGQQKNLKPAIRRAKLAGASKVIVHDLKKSFVKDFIWPALQANAVYENDYPLATALSRPLIARELVLVAKKEGAQAIGHGCTGKGNDQVRFEITAQILNPSLKVIAPLREWDLKSREEEIAYAKDRGVSVDVTKKSPYSIDENLWGVSIECGVLENPWSTPPADCYLWTRGCEKRNPKPVELVINFSKGIPQGLNGKRMEGVALIRELNQKGSNFGIGRSDMVEGRLVGIKSREIYESPAATILLKAHRDLESLTLERSLHHYKQGLSATYANLVYEGLWYTELKQSLDAFIQRTQRYCTGSVKVRLEKSHVSVIGRKSPHSLYKETLATYGDKDEFNPKSAIGFIELLGLPHKVRRGNRER